MALAALQAPESKLSADSSALWVHVSGSEHTSLGLSEGQRNEYRISAQRVCGMYAGRLVLISKELWQ